MSQYGPENAPEYIRGLVNDFNNFVKNLFFKEVTPIVENFQPSSKDAVAEELKDTIDQKYDEVLHREDVIERFKQLRADETVQQQYKQDNKAVLKLFQAPEQEFTIPDELYDKIFNLVRSNLHPRVDPSNKQRLEGQALESIPGTKIPNPALDKMDTGPARDTISNTRADLNNDPSQGPMTSYADKLDADAELGFKNKLKLINTPKPMPTRKLTDELSLRR